MPAMEFLQSIDWSELTQNAGIITTLLFSTYSIRKDNQARRLSNLNAITDRHREIWREMYSRPSLSRVLNSHVDLKDEPVSQEEYVFVNELIIHLGTAHSAMKEGMFTRLDGLKKDIIAFFSLPVPKAVWEQSRTFQNLEFIMFVDETLAKGASPGDGVKQGS